ncbi:CBS domain-containing protein [Thermoactinomyces sp. DSM 45891]|uniref:CBS domain-containing protein n=1 Tax=Thermoactinomyces sp. DSM 45891 TaxID=1761907 RepID=UPI000923D956|nr:CBS domain-containing protein [Thermoactinomyces sp. DSM 45891]SFX45133.1 CBS domain-containing protein [Thermoactinomyces sp. DSM 45891]
MSSPVREIMSTDLQVLSPDDNIYEAALMMRQKDVGIIPVCENGKICGVVTDRDLVIRGIAEKRPNSSQIGEVMSDELVTGSPDMTVDDVALLMADYQVRRLPIVENEMLVGVVSLGDLAVHMPYMNEASEALNEISHNTDHGYVQ